MKFLLFSLPALLFTCSELLAQEILPPLSKAALDLAFRSGTSTFTSFECSGLKVAGPPATDWQVAVTPVMHREQDASTKTIKDSLFALKVINNLPFGSDRQPMKTIDTIIQNASFPGYAAPGFTPTDNTIAISNGGLIVHAVNASFEVFNDQGVQLQTQISFRVFVADPNLIGNYFDPKVIYDSQSDRFVMIVLHSFAPSKSRLVMMFSKTSNPLDGWWVYKIAGDALGNKSWLDYPNLAVNNDEVFVTGNLYDSSGDFRESIIFQIGKEEGYAGSALQTRIWSKIKVAQAQIPFTLVPAGYGQQGNYGPGIFLVSTLPEGGNRVFLFRITGDRNDPSSLMLSFKLRVPDYLFPANAMQRGSMDLLDAGKCRVRNAFYMDGIIHFAFASANVNGYSQVSYVRIDSDAMLALVGNLSFNGMDYTYPAVASFSTSENNKSALIVFTCSGAEVFPEIRVSTCDDQMNFNNSQLAFPGSSPVNKLAGSPERWGDYTGISRRHNSGFPDVWIAAPFGASQTWNTRIMRYSGEKDTAVVNDSTHSIKFYPNPVKLADFYFTFTESSNIDIILYDLQGKEVKQLFNDVILKGEKRILFNKAGLATGFYIAIIRSNGRVIGTEKIVVLDKY
jgi:hypothetical protein